MTTLLSPQPFMRATLSRVLRLWQILPQGHSLESEEWLRRHRGIVWLLWLHAVVVPVFGLVMGRYVSLALIAGAVLAGLALLVSRFGTRVPVAA